ncbi:O-acetyl-ADP-ribose deacetylase [bacterium]|nr:O-acetyl-ADP-ribose deacetylase [bacterium]
MVTRFASTRIVLKQGDITREKVDAIVNAANSHMRGGGGVDGAIHRAGGPAILEDCKRVVPDGTSLAPGKVVMTTAGQLPARVVIHTVGPVWAGGSQGEDETLALCYINCLHLAASAGLKTLAFPAISTGVYGYPFDLACSLALHVIREFCRVHPAVIEEVRLIYFNQADHQAAKTHLSALNSE